MMIQFESRKHTIVGIFACVALFTFAFWSRPATAADEAPAKDDPEAIKQEDPSFFVRIGVDRVTRQYRHGDPLVVKVTSESDAYAYVLYKQADGKVYQIFPNSAQPDNLLRAKQPTSIPAEGDTFTWTVGAPYGRETLKVIASKEKLPSLSAQELYEGRFNKVPPQVVEDTKKALGSADPKGWAEDSIDITTYASDPKTEEPTGRRVGLFFGVSEFKYNDRYKEIHEGKWSPNLDCCAPDARLTAQVMKEVSHLDEVRILVNQEATKAGIEEGITKWLPSVTRPGDTVVIFIETHGDGVDDDNGDERDGKDEYFMTQEFADLSLYSHFRKQRTAGTISDDDRRSLEVFEAFIAANQQTMKKLGDEQLNKLLNMVLIHQSCVTDDLFGHWLQKLAGRKVVVMMATCHAGGFAKNEKSLKPAERAAEIANFDFLTGELGRLKDIGQPDTVVISACTTKEVSYSFSLSNDTIDALKRRTGADLTLKQGDFMHTLPFGLIESLAVSPPRQPIDVAFRDIRDRVLKYIAANEKNFAETDGKLRHEPQFYDFSTRPIYLKP
ncbi:MAG: DUF4384 domain-containing protein [Planctomycetia bacterium]|nr:DUF4384 domain-containing protein [Planctomycetia bacterium]